MKDTVYKILKAHGLVEEFEQAKGGEFHLRLVNDPYMPLVIEKISDNEVSVAHYGELNGDAMRNPEMVFKIVPDTSIRLTKKGMVKKDIVVWKPTYFRNDYMGAESFVYNVREGVEYYGATLAMSLKSFQAMWSKNLIDQGFAKKDCIAISNTHNLKEK